MRVWNREFRDEIFASALKSSPDKLDKYLNKNISCQKNAENIF